MSQTQTEQNQSEGISGVFFFRVMRDTAVKSRDALVYLWNLVWACAASCGGAISRGFSSLFGSFFSKKEDKKEELTATETAAPVQTKPVVLRKPTCVDNPGGGDCLYYAISLDLVRIINHETALHEADIATRWCELDPKMTLPQLHRFTYAQLSKSQPGSAEQAHWFELQQSLRRILVSTHLNATHAAIILNELEQNWVYQQFLEVYLRPDTLDEYNPFGSNALQLEEQFAAIRAMNLPAPARDAELQRLFVSLFNRSETGASPVIERLNVMVNTPFWGTDEDLYRLTAQFGVNAKMKSPGMGPQIPGTLAMALHQPSVPHQYTVTVINHNNGHWVSPIYASSFDLDAVQEARRACRPATGM